MINGMPTLAGWWNFAQEMSLFGAFGAAGALAMWFTRKRLTSTDK
jgi:hypothetical protein